MKRAATVRVGGFARRALMGEESVGAEHEASRAERALRTYLGDRGRGRTGWHIPPFVRVRRERAQLVELQLSLDEDLWEALEVEAAEQDVTVDRLVEHAFLYHASEVDAGRITQRIIENLDDE